jgi:hypothetical protein
MSVYVYGSGNDGSVPSLVSGPGGEDGICGGGSSEGELSNVLHIVSAGWGGG